MCTKSCISGGGILNRINLKVAEGYIYGNISIKTSASNIISFNVFQSEITRNNKQNYAYDLMKKVMDDFSDCTTENPDMIEIEVDDKYPNANVRFKFDEHFKNLKVVRKTKTPSNRIIFKIYGLLVNDFDEDYVNCTAIDYEDKLSDIKIKNNGRDFENGEIYDVVGDVKEGLVGGIPINELVMVNARKSREKIDFIKGIRSGEVSPF
jgi:hypothetical protein